MRRATAARRKRTGSGASGDCLAGSSISHCRNNRVKHPCLTGAACCGLAATPAKFLCSIGQVGTRRLRLPRRSLIPDIGRAVSASRLPGLASRLLLASSVFDPDPQVSPGSGRVFLRCRTKKAGQPGSLHDRRHGEASRLCRAPVDPAASRYRMTLRIAGCSALVSGAGWCSVRLVQR